MTIKEARRILERSAKGCIAYVYDNGYGWYFDKFISAIRHLEGQRRATRRDRYLISDAHYIDGDVHDFNGAPQAAIRSYQLCLRWDPTAAGAWREMGHMHDRLGHAEEALRCFRKAVEIEPKDDNNTGDLESFLKWGPLKKKDLDSRDPGWKVREALASLNPRAALRFLKSTSSSRMHQLRARAFGALSDTEAVVREWETIARRKERFCWENGDWFYAPSDVYCKSLRFWEAQRKIWRRWDPKISGHASTCAPEGLWEIVRPYRRKWLMVIWFHIAELKKDHKLALKLSRRYPKWKEAVALAKKLRRNG